MMCGARHVAATLLEWFLTGEQQLFAGQLEKSRKVILVRSHYSTIVQPGTAADMPGSASDQYRYCHGIAI